MENKKGNRSIVKEIERQIAEIQDTVETCNLAPYKKKEYEDKIKKLRKLISRYKQ